TLPLQSCRMIASLFLCRNFAAVDRDRTRLRAAVETNAAPGASVPDIASGMDAVSVQALFKFQAIGRTRLHAQAAALALFPFEGDFAAIFRHIHLVTVWAASGRCNHLVCSQYV